MSNIIELAALAIAVPASLVSLNKLFPVANRRKLVSTVAEFAESETGIRFSNNLVYLATIGMLLEGFVVSYCVAGGVRFSVLGLYLGLITFTAFAAFALFIFKNGNRK
jgi:hypothetical protein